MFIRLADELMKCGGNSAAGSVKKGLSSRDGEYVFLRRKKASAAVCDAQSAAQPLIAEIRVRTA